MAYQAIQRMRYQSLGVICDSGCLDSPEALEGLVGLLRGSTSGCCSRARLSLIVAYTESGWIEREAVMKDGNTCLVLLSTRAQSLFTQLAYLSHHPSNAWTSALSSGSSRRSKTRL